MRVIVVVVIVVVVIVTGGKQSQLLAFALGLGWSLTIILPILSRNLELRLDEMTAEISDKVSRRKGTLPEMRKA